jgi:hypothetical protein
VQSLSFTYTADRLLAGAKTVTRRKGWHDLKPGTTLLACREGWRRGAMKGRGPLGRVRVLSVRRERLGDITPEEVALEGYPELTPAEFLARFFAGADPDTEVNRIEFERVGAWAATPAPPPA